MNRENAGSIHPLLLAGAATAMILTTFALHHFDLGHLMEQLLFSALLGY